MKTLFNLATLPVFLVLLGSTEARMGAHRHGESTLPVHEDAGIEKREQKRNLRRKARPFSNPNAFDENDNFVRVMVGFKNENGRGVANRITGRKWMQEMKNSRVSTMLIPRVSFESLRKNPNIE
jgi:hypothetical protein